MSSNSRREAWASCQSVILEFLNKSESVKYVGPVTKKFYRQLNHPEGRMFLFAKEVKPNRLQVVVDRIDGHGEETVTLNLKDRIDASTYSLWLRRYKVTEQFAIIREMQKTLYEAGADITPSVMEGQVMPEFVAAHQNFSDQGKYRATYLRWLKLCRENFPDDEKQPTYNQLLSKVLKGEADLVVHEDNVLGWVIIGRVKQMRVADLDKARILELLNEINSWPYVAWTLRVAVEQRLYELEKGV